MNEGNPHSRPNHARLCPVCGCPQAALLLVSVACASPRCRWHDSGHEQRLSVHARSEVTRWRQSQEARN
jgi:hypothetical protein